MEKLQKVYYLLKCYFRTQSIIINKKKNIWKHFVNKHKAKKLFNELNIGEVLFT